MASERKYRRHRKDDNPYFKYEKSEGGRDAMVLNDTGLELVTKLASFQCTVDEIASVLDCARSTLSSDRNIVLFTDAYEKGKNVGKVKIRAKLHERMDKGSDSCIIFGCKAILGMSDSVVPAVDSSTLENLVRAIDKIKDAENDAQDGAEGTDEA